MKNKKQPNSTNVLTPMTAEERHEMAVHTIRSNYKSALRAAETAKLWLVRDLTERVPGMEFTPGNIAASAGKLEAALEKACR